ncbi:MurR/RpiR family transcriptional regulator [Streptococcus porcinus]|uniref:MurR/RpiR family transcriptional regulator n=1 Tax=Streptococcus porcinus TaxID=1340 RepID=A0A7V9WS67_STRPO|nr:MurR/RpiR family transcriptional regulator [Streptococcus porcinus]MBA2796105.1 MurR/RpiR family transcriptional regulator [Streptococcus porcinus]
MLEKISLWAKKEQSSKATIAQTIIEHLGEIERISLNDLAKLSYSSKPSIVRFAQALGYKGWTDFLPALLSERFYSDTHYSDVDHNLPFQEEDSSQAIIQKVATIAKESIQDTADQMSTEALEKAGQELRKARRIVVFGLSPNDYIAQLFRRKMLTLGKIVEVAHTSEFGLMTASLRKGDIAILVSYSGTSESSDTLKHLRLLKERGIFIIGLSSHFGTYLKDNSDAFFAICPREDKHRKIANFSTEESILFILNSLYAIYFQSDYMGHYIRKLTLSKELEKER